ncbi:GNAT family N-acetyltransferase [Glaciimonas sp. PCH181]|uniref:GNAT family N-acetyltransferase n=1 Tax=Glaciimonas sp. PCH181 TaxID=2133943 RepID=UPI000D33277F|nr:GNAT family N-acetyltransferase [Glaciimonas sp. PCH181]PUA17324.1 N-acetyltransferase [Glaciimonas sp. PCH181]
MALRLRFLLDTNILIPLQDSYQVLEPNLTDFVRLAGVGGHQLLYHPATIADFRRDTDEQRREMNLHRLAQYSQLDNPARCPWNTPETTANEACDNEILYALECDAVHALVTEDRGIHGKARTRGLSDRVYTIQMAQYWLRGLHEPKQEVLPNIEDVPLHSLTPSLATDFFDSLREGYAGFDEWFRRTARDDRRAWVYRDEHGNLSALCIYTVQNGEVLNDAKECLTGDALKLCTFKVGEKVRGRKIGELFLKAAFRYATNNACEHLFIHADAERHDYLLRLLEDFGFEERGTYSGDLVMVKTHPLSAPEPAGLPPLDYARRYFPHFRYDADVQKFIVPILPEYHETLFPDYSPHQGRLFNPSNSVGNAIKLAYLCHAKTTAIGAGDVLLFYRTHDEMSVTTIGIVDKFKVLQDPAEIASLVSRRTVYSQEEIETMAKKQTKVILFRSVEHLSRPVSYAQLQRECGVAGPIQSIRHIHDDQFSKVLTAAGWKSHSSFN